MVSSTGTEVSACACVYVVPGASGVFDDPEDGLLGDGMGGDDEVAVCDAAMRLVVEYGAQAAMMQVMYAAKQKLDKELKDLEASDKAAEGGAMEENIEDPDWRIRVQDQMQLKELERQLGRIDDPFKEKEYYLDKWGYEVNETGEMPYSR